MTENAEKPDNLILIIFLVYYHYYCTIIGIKKKFNLLTGGTE